MDFICANCGNKFESRETTPRCPSCLRKHTVIASEDQKNSPRFKLNIKIMFLAIFGLLSLIIISVVIYRQLKQNSKTSTVGNQVQEEQINEILKKQGFQDFKQDLQLTPFQVDTLPEKYKQLNQTKIQKLIDKEIKNRITWEIPSRIDTPQQISTQIEKNNDSRHTVLEWAAFLKQVLAKSNIQVNLAQVKKINDKYSRHPLEIGNYVLVLQQQESDDKKSQSFIYPAGSPSDSISEFTLLTPKQTIARFMTLKALSLLKIKDRFNFLLPFSAKPAQVNSKLVLKLLNTAFELDPESKEIKAAYFWAFTRLRIYKEAYKWLKRLEASSDHPGIKELKAIAKITRNDLRAAMAELENPSASYQRLHFYLKLMNGKETSRKKAINLSKENNEFSSYLATMYFLMNDKKQAQTYLEKTVKQRPDSPWAVNLLFTYFLNSGNIAGARKLIPKVAVMLQKRGKNKIKLENIKKDLEEKINKLEKEIMQKNEQDTEIIDSKDK
ncbi:MAG: hypothetical protein PF689_08905 [Deltaproteobacteria bacterium]|jgi:tetratricopeptide (TPR) repeat protein|nr:hypothetical protein [Deltaproteobacteria bacterium]